MKRLRNSCTGRWPVHVCQSLGAIAAGVTLAVAPVSAVQAAAPAKAAAAKPTYGLSVDDFYRARNGAPLWLTPVAGNAAQRLLLTLGNARFDGLDPGKYPLDEVRKAMLDTSKGKPKAIERADRLLSDAFVAYVRDMRRDPGAGVIYVDPDLRPSVPTARAILGEAASAPSLAAYVDEIGWMNPIYGQLRRALLGRQYSTEQERDRLALNLERARTLPSGKGRYLIVNSAAQRLYMVEDGRIVDSMRVVVGKPKNPTPVMTAWVRFAALNPYWYVPPDLAAERIAPKVLQQGVKYLDGLGYQVLDDWVENPRFIDPSTIDWQGVADGKTEVFIRQLPGPHNSMGRMKFMFPNAQGVYLHDNPERELFEQAARLYSGGCVRLEDAARLGRWLFGRDLVWEGAGTEEKVPLARPVPVYITYLTAMPEGASIAYFDDVYSRDAQQLAQRRGATALAGGEVGLTDTSSGRK